MKIPSEFYDFYGDYYELFDYLRKVKLDSRTITKDYGKKAAFILNHTCGVIVKRGGLSIDGVARDYGFELEDFFRHISEYKPKYKEIKKLKEEMEQW